MATIDLSRAATDFRKHYLSVFAQMGRVFDEDDHNESERLRIEDARRTRADVIGPAGTPDDGLLIANPRVTAGRVDFDITPGTFYLGGLRLEVDRAETFQTQADWLQLAGADLPAPPAAGTRLDLVYCEGWVQPCSAVEDNELFEVGLGGPDTGVCLKVMRRVRVGAGVASDDCMANLQGVLDLLTPPGAGTLNDENELAPDTLLKVGFAPGSDPGDLCNPPVAGGYLGADNQAIRVQFVGAATLTWGFDNAAPLYRAQVGTNAAGQRRVITLLTEPKDQAHWLAAGQVVEVLPWSAVLPNNEKLAGPSGFLARVDGAYAPDTQQFTITLSVPAGFGEAWKARPDAPQLGAAFFYVRVWNRGADTASPLAIPFVAGTPLTLGQTGLSVTVTGADRPAEAFWIIAARPDAPNRVVPWLLEQGRQPHGYRRFYAPLAVIQWTTVGGVTTGTVLHDCRDTFPPLTRVKGCCTHTVGDGVSSFGKFASIQAAVDALPAAGGEVCILPGVYAQSVRVEDRVNVTIHGCGRRTRLTGAPGSNAPVIHVIGSRQVTVRDLAVEALRVVGVLMENSPGRQQQWADLREVVVEDLEVAARDRAAIACVRGTDITVRRNQITLQILDRPLDAASPVGKSPAVFFQVRLGLLELNRIVHVAKRALVSPLGGIQIGGGSMHVEVRRNLVVGGNGNGITLGSLSYLTPDNFAILSADYVKAMVGAIAGWSFGFTIVVDANGCIHLVPDPPDGGGPNDPRVPVSDGDLYDIRIIDNEILQMGGSGIASVRFIRRVRPIVIVVHVLQVELNRINQNLRLDLGNQEIGPTSGIGLGGIALAACEYLTVRDNWIQDNGRDSPDPVCGVYVQYGAGVLIEGNQVTGNGSAGPDPRQAKPGPRGGILVDVSTPPFSDELPAVLSTGAKPTSAAAAPRGFPALRVCDNVVVAPLGRALYTTSAGAVSVVANQLTTRAVALRTYVSASTVNQPLAEFGAAVLVNAVAAAPELGAAHVTYSTMGFNQPLTAYAGGGGLLMGFILAPRDRFVGGNVLFDDNQVTLEADRLSDAFIVSAVTVFSPSDVSIASNQSDCRLRENWLLTNVWSQCRTLRMTANRCHETLDTRGMSALTMAQMNDTANNQGTRCFVAAGVPQLLVNRPNRALITMVAPQYCPVLQHDVNAWVGNMGFSTQMGAAL
jgi:hypothetical protein